MKTGWKFLRHIPLGSKQQNEKTHFYCLVELLLFREGISIKASNVEYGFFNILSTEVPLS